MPALWRRHAELPGWLPVMSAEQLDEVGRHVATVMRLGLVGACPEPMGVDDEARLRWVMRIAEWSDWIHAQYAAVLTEGVAGARHELVARGDARGIAR